MSRYREPSFDEEGGYKQPPSWGRWEGARKQAVYSKRGQRDLLALIAALDALPRRRLLHGALCHRGEVCAVGALALVRLQEGGMTRREAMKFLPQHTEEEQRQHAAPCDDDYDLEDTAAFAENYLGLTWTLAWEMAFANDELVCGPGMLFVKDTLRNGNPAYKLPEELTPEERWVSVREWALSQLTEEHRATVAPTPTDALETGPAAPADHPPGDPF